MKESLKTCGDYELLALSFDGTKPRFAESVKKQRTEGDALTLYYTAQCPYIPNCVEQVDAYCKANSIPLKLMKIDTLTKAKAVPCVFNNWAVFCRGEFLTTHLLNEGQLQKLLNGMAI